MSAVVGVAVEMPVSGHVNVVVSATLSYTGLALHV
jgi:hypothetical protein